MNPLDLERREMHLLLNRPGDHPDASTVWTRRSFMNQALLKGGVGIAAAGFMPIINTLDMAYGQAGQSFRFAWVSDTHLYPKDVNTRFVDKAVRAFKEVQR